MKRSNTLFLCGLAVLLLATGCCLKQKDYRNDGDRLSGKYVAMKQNGERGKVFTVVPAGNGWTVAEYRDVRLEAVSPADMRDIFGREDVRGMQCAREARGMICAAPAGTMIEPDVYVSDSGYFAIVEGRGLFDLQRVD